jgi:hypothetical protein
VREVRFVYGVPSPGFLDFSLNFKVLFKFGDYVHMNSVRLGGGCNK